MKNWLKKLLYRAGYEIKRLGPQTPKVVWIQLLRHAKVDLVLDVGANTGQSGEMLRLWGYDGKIVSFEPLEDAHRELLRRASKDSEWVVAERLAIGALDGQVILNRSANSQSSSILPMLGRHEENAEESRYVGQEIVPLRRLETASCEWAHQASSIMLKVDTQGYEDAVLQGVGTLWPKVTVIEIELSVEPLYEGQVLWLDTIRELESRGYELMFLEPVFSDALTGKVLQYDGLFLVSKKKTKTK